MIRIKQTKQTITWASRALLFPVCFVVVVVFFLSEIDIFAHFCWAIFRQALQFLILWFTDENSNTIYIIQIGETVFYACFHIQVNAAKILEGIMKRANLRWQLYDHTCQCQRKAAAPISMSQICFQQGMMSERNLIRAGGKVTRGKQRGKWLLFARFLLALVLFVILEPDTSHHKRA